MKKFTLELLLFLFLFGSAFAQQEKGIIGDNNWLENWTEFNPKQSNYREPNKILTGNITEDLTLNKRDTYLLIGSVFVTNNATLTIEPGTVIIGDYDTKASLTIAKGSFIVAEGLETDPIVFTSNRSVKRAGDWGGIFILGDAPTNKFGNGSVVSFFPGLATKDYAYTGFGGDNAESCSGILRYVRIEYAGKRIKGAGYLNGLLLAGVGNQTVLENIMMSYSGGDAIEVWGGDVILKKVVSYRTSSNDFKFNYGVQCELFNSIAIRSPYISSSEGSRCFQILAYDDIADVDFSKPGTSVVAKNVTMINNSENLAADVEKGLVKEAVFVAYNTSLEMSKTVISGFNPAVIFEEKININQESLDQIKFSNMYFNNCNGNIFVEHNSNNEDLENWYGNSSFFNVYAKSRNSETFINIRDERMPDYRLRINEITSVQDVNMD
ncbi:MULTISPECIES: hypothetical protein [unclassified Algibacter]|uniref:hypothetical protein n=1 Tax=unclassified Algibacter TaxID=2615009 RepID=UPI00131C769F|nr:MULTISPECIES: hypothetical protein [unclassified Algibacter]MCL5128343.1 hypothetical protein [Algibacter sp. L4_22]